MPGFNRFVDAYDLAGLAGDDQPSSAAVEVSAAADRLFASDLRRAVESAERIANGRPFATSPLLREVPIALPPIPIPLPIDVWDTITNAVWIARRISRVDTAGVLARAAAAADWLIEQSAASRSVAVITHGTFRVMLGHELRRRGLTQAAGGYDLRNWSVWSFKA